MTGAERLAAAYGSINPSEVEAMSHLEIAGAMLAWLEAHPEPGVTRTTSWQLHWNARVGADSWQGGWTDPDDAKTALMIERVKRPDVRWTVTRTDATLRRTEEPW